MDDLMLSSYNALADDIISRAQKNQSSGSPFLVGLVGPPGAGKSTMAEQLAKRIPHAVVVPMDGFHYYRRELDEFADPIEAHRRRGADFTFNSTLFVRKIRQLKALRSSNAMATSNATSNATSSSDGNSNSDPGSGSNNGIITFPSFDHGVGDPKEDDIVVNVSISPHHHHHRVVIIEGNYLLLDKQPWTELKNGRSPAPAPANGGANDTGSNDSSVEEDGNGDGDGDGDAKLDLIVYIDAPMETIRQRIILRHMRVHPEMSEAQAVERVDGSDMLNALQIDSCKHRADVIVPSL